MENEKFKVKNDFVDNNESDKLCGTKMMVS